jgi:hypothetical protein
MRNSVFVIYVLFFSGIVFTFFSGIVLPTSVSQASTGFPNSCPNEILRSELHSAQLPDCRAYELVTPQYKEGQFVSGLFAISEDGSHLLGASFGAFSGTAGDGLGGESSLLGATYEFASPTTSSSSTWQAKSLVPPASEYSDWGIYDASADLGTTLWELAKLSPPAPPEGAQAEGVSDFYRESPDGTITRVGPTTPNPYLANNSEYAYIGASASLSHILFSTAAGFHWPFDETAEGSSTLYEYLGTGQSSPSLVGVAPNSNKLVSDCGTRLGSSTPLEPNGSMYNAISAGGERIFFTAVGEDDNPCGAPQPPADELLAREEVPSESGTARTIPISCPEAPSPCADANFEGASKDGSKVFFTSTQKLLAGASEDNTPGDSAVGVGLSTEEKKGCAQTAGPGGCNLYEYNFNAPPPHLSLVSGGCTEPGGARVQGVSRISEDGSHVYFVAKCILTGANREGYMPTAEADNLYAYEPDPTTPGLFHTVFIATLSSKGRDTWARADNRPVLASADGSLLVFESTNDLTHEDIASNVGQIFQYDAQTETLVRVSIGEDGYNNDNRTPDPEGNIAIGSRSAYVYSDGDSPTQTTSVLAPQNEEVFFSSTDALTPEALNDQTDARGDLVPNVYEYHSGHVYLISDGRDTSVVHSDAGVRLLGSDVTGDDVFFMTSDSLTGQDTDTQQDIYDARIDGGAQISVEPPVCSGEGCHGPLGITPTLLEPGSAAQSPESGIQPISPMKPSTRAKARPKAKAKSPAKAKRRRKTTRRTGKAAIRDGGHRRSGSR